MEEFKNHTFAICAYKESKYLEKCIESLEKQTVKSNIIMITSTPNDYIKNIAQKHNIPLLRFPYTLSNEKIKQQICEYHLSVTTAGCA